MGRRLQHIDGLRGIAALAVVIQHACQMVQNAGVPYYGFFLDRINLGRFGVVLFFLISGLVIPFSFRGETPLRDFAISRFFRLYPVYWLSIPVLGALVVRSGGSLGTPLILTNMTMLQGLWNGRTIGGGYWTLTYEMVFYVFCALIFWRGKLDSVKFNGFAVLVWLVLAVAPIALAVWAGEPQFLTRAPYFVAMFFLGMLLRRAFVDDDAAARQWAMLLVPLAIATAVMTSGWIVPMVENANVYLRPLQLSTGAALPVVAFVLVLWRRPVPGKALSWLAGISYSLYLFQDVGLLLLPSILPPGQWPIGYVLAVIGLTIAIAMAVNRFVERPMIALGRALIARRTAPPEGAVPA